MFPLSPILANPHAQTIFAALLRWQGGPRVRRERMELADGDFLDVDVATPAAPARGAPWVLVLHGLEGSSSAPYVRGLARGLVGYGIEACLLNFRGCSGVPNRLPRSYHSGESADVREALGLLAAQRPGRPFGLAGFSIGANILMKMLGEDGDRAPAALAAAVGLSPPFDLEASALHLDQPRGFVYRMHLLLSLRAKALAKIAHFPGLADERAVRRAWTFQAFDEVYTARLHGFDGALDYWRRCSGARYLGSIARELLLIASDDDPFFPAGYVPREALAANPRVRLQVAPHGGHVGFVAGSPLAPRYWAEERALEHLVQRLT